MKHLYFYGASDDCHEIDGVGCNGDEGYGDMSVSLSFEEATFTLTAKYQYDGDWSVSLYGTPPKGCRIKAIEGNMPGRVSDYPGSIAVGQFIHLEIPDRYEVEVSPIEDDEDE